MSDSKDRKGKAPEGRSSDKKSKNEKDGSVKITPQMAESLLENNPALRNEMAGMDKEKAAEAMRKMNIAELLTGLSVSGKKNQKDMASYKFWQTQPVPRFDETSTDSAGGPIKIIDPEKVPKEPDTLIEGFEWTTLDVTNETELHELWDLLTYHYVEDDNAMFRFRYSESFLHWWVHNLAEDLFLGHARMWII
jgi:glycylpeptide N-tetradecanoyltransferase